MSEIRTIFNEEMAKLGWIYNPESDEAINGFIPPDSDYSEKNGMLTEIQMQLDSYPAILSTFERLEEKLNLLEQRLG